MKRSGVFIFFWAMSLCFTGNLFAQDASSVSDRKTSPFFVVETADEDAVDSLNRISGKIDLGFSSPEHSYKSEKSYSAGGLGRRQSPEKAD